MVIVIIGVIVTITTISVGALGTDREVEDETRRFAALVTQAKEEAELQGREIGIMVTRVGYEFFGFDAKRQIWSPIDEDDFYKPRELPEGLTVRLWLEGREVVLQQQAESSKENAESDDEPPAESLVKEGLGIVNKGPVPQINLFSSGEINGFELRIEREGTDHVWHAVSKPDNTVEAEEFDAIAAP